MVADAYYYYLSIIFFLSAEEGVKLFPEWLLEDKLRASRGPTFSPSSFLVSGFYERLFFKEEGIPVIEEASMASLRLLKALEGDCTVFLTIASFSELPLALLNWFYTDFF